MSLGSDVRRRIFEYLEGRLSERNFRDWFVARTWNQLDCATADEQALCGEVELRFAEYSNGHLSEAELRDYLERAASFSGPAARPWQQGGIRDWPRVPRELHSLSRSLSAVRSDSVTPVVSTLRIKASA